MFPTIQGPGKAPEGGAAKNPVQDGKAACSPSGAVKVQDRRPLAGRPALQGETCVFRVGGGRQGTASDCSGRPGIVRDGGGCRGLHE